MLTFGLLGPLTVALDGQPIPIGGARQRLLVSLLALSVNQPIGLDRLVERAWGTAAEPRRNTLQQCVCGLRRKLAADRQLEIRSCQGGYVLRVDPWAIDVQHFEALRRGGRRALAEGDAARSANIFQQALALWRGPALADVTESGFSWPEQANLEELRLRVLEDRIEADLMSGRCAELIPELETLTHDHPRRERMRAQFMVALVGAGRREDAMVMYRDHHAWLRRRRLALPEAQLMEEELAGALVHYSPWLASGGHRNARRPVSASRGPGREFSLALLADAERQLLAQVTVFRGGFTIAAAREICIGLPTDDLIDRLDSLAHNGLLSMAVSPGTVRYDLPDSTRSVAEDLSQPPDRTRRVRARHAGYFTTIAQRAISPLEPDDLECWAAHFTEEYENIQAALAWTMGHDSLAAAHICVAAAMYWHRCGKLHDGQGWLHRLVELVQLPKVLAEGALCDVPLAVLAHTNLQQARAYVAALDITRERHGQAVATPSLWSQARGLASLASSSDTRSAS